MAIRKLMTLPSGAIVPNVVTPQILDAMPKAPVIGQPCAFGAAL